MMLHFSGVRRPGGDLPYRLGADRRRSPRPTSRPLVEELESRQLLSGGLTLTAAAQAAGFNLTTFTTGFPSRSDGLGPYGIAFPPSGGVLVDDGPGNVRLFPTDADGQDATTVPPVAGATYGQNHAEGMAVLNNNIYLNLGELNQVGSINPDGTLKKVVANVPNADGMTIDPLDGHLIVSAFGSAIYDVDPVAGTASVLLNVAADGLAFDPVAGILYAALYPASGPGDEVKGFDIQTKAVVFDSGTITGGPDGIALGVGTLAGNVFVNTNSGTLVEVNLKTDAQTLIASGGSRGDFVTVDPNNGTLLVSQSDRLLRLAGPAGGGFVPTSSGLVTTTTTLDAGLNPTASGATVTLTAAVTTAASVAPTGSITFTIDGVAQPPVAVASVGGRVLATFTTASLAPGTHTFSAAYSGDATFAPSASGPVQRIVPQPAGSGADGPTVTLVRRSAARVRPTELLLNFDESLAPGPAQDLADYHLVKVKKKSTRPIGIKSAVYDPAAQTVTLTLARRINLRRGLRLTIDGTGPNPVAGVSGVRLDGQGNGRPGSDYVAVVNNANPIFQVAKPARHGARKT